MARAGGSIHYQERDGSFGGSFVTRNILPNGPLESVFAEQLITCLDHSDPPSHLIFRVLSLRSLFLNCTSGFSFIALAWPSKKPYIPSTTTLVAIKVAVCEHMHAQRPKM
jgi:hypothetical protein